MLNFSLLGCLALNLHKSRLGGRGKGQIYFFRFFQLGSMLNFTLLGCLKLVLKLVVGGVLRIVSGGGCVNQFLC